MTRCVSRAQRRQVYKGIHPVRTTFHEYLVLYVPHLGVSGQQRDLQHRRIGNDAGTVFSWNTTLTLSVLGDQ